MKYFNGNIFGKWNIWCSDLKVYFNDHMKLIVDFNGKVLGKWKTLYQKLRFLNQIAPNCPKLSKMVLFSPIIVYNLFNFIWFYSKACRKISKQRWDTHQRCRTFVTSFRIILKLVESFKICEKSEKYLGDSGRYRTFVYFIWNYSKACWIIFKIVW